MYGTEDLRGLVEIGIRRFVLHRVVATRDAIGTRSQKLDSSLGGNPRNEGCVLTVDNTKVDAVRFSEVPEILFKVLEPLGTRHVTNYKYFQVFSSFYTLTVSS